MGRTDQNLRQAERCEPPGAREPSARHLQFVAVVASERDGGNPSELGRGKREEGIHRGAYEVGGSGAAAEPARDAEQEVLPEEERGVRPVAALPREGLEPGAEVGTVGIVPPAGRAHLRSHRRLPPLAGNHRRGAQRAAAAAVGSPGSEIRIAGAGGFRSRLESREPR